MRLRFSFLFRFSLRFLCRSPQQAFEQLCQGEEGGIELEDWVRLSPAMGLSDLLTADNTFKQLATNDGGSSTQRSRVTFDTFDRYVRHIAEKSYPVQAPAWVIFNKMGTCIQKQPVSTTRTP